LAGHFRSLVARRNLTDLLGAWPRLIATGKRRRWRSEPFEFVLNFVQVDSRRTAFNRQYKYGTTSQRQVTRVHKRTPFCTDVLRRRLSAGAFTPTPSDTTTARTYSPCAIWSPRSRGTKRLTIGANIQRITSAVENLPGDFSFAINTKNTLYLKIIFFEIHSR